MQELLIENNGMILKIDGQRWKLLASETNGVFSCHAECLDPKDAEEAKYCLIDLWRSESVRAARMLVAFVQRAKELDMGECLCLDRQIGLAEYPQW